MPISRHRRRRGRGASQGSRDADSLSLARPRRKKTNKLYLIAAITIAVLVIGSFGLTAVPFGGGGGGGGARTGNNNAYVPEVGIEQTILGADHLDEGTLINYLSFPPTSGEHWPPHVLRRCGFYENGLRDEVTVHHLEHGNIVISYNFNDQDQVDHLRRVVDDIGLANSWGITRYYDKIPEGQVAVAAWGVLDTMDGVDESGLRTFFEYAGNLGPEEVPCG